MEPFSLLVAIVILVIIAWRFSTQTASRDTIDRGREYLMAGLPDKALAVFQRIAQKRDRAAPGREQALYWLARTHEELGDPARAKALYRQYMAEYVQTNAADPEVRQLVQHRLSRITAGSEPRVQVAHPSGTDATDWARYKAERDALLVRVRENLIRVKEKGDGPHIHVEPHATEPHVAARLVSPPEALPVSPEKVMKDLNAVAAGRRIGDYVLAEKLGEGGFGEVYRALRPVAIKLARDPTVVEHLRRFGTIQSQVKSDRVVKPLEVNLEADPPYVVMELVDGCTLRDLLETKEVKDSEALAILREVALGLRDAHEAGVLHLDLKPENVLVDESGMVKLTDFELGKMNEESAQLRLSRSLGTKESDAKIAGTIAYMSPEQRDGKVPDARSDVYTFGILLFEALTGEHPQPGDKISDFRKDLPHVAELDRIFERCFTRHERRYASARDLARDVESVCERLPKADLAALMRAAPEARARVAGRAVAPPSGEKATEKPGAEKPVSEVSVQEKEPRDPEPSEAEKKAADALIAARAAAARAAEAGAAVQPAEKPVEKPAEPPAPVRPPIPVATETPPPLPAAVRPPIPVETAAPPAPANDAESKHVETTKPQLEAG